MTVVIDASVFVSAAASPAGLSRRCFVLFARRQFNLAVTEQILNEYEASATGLAQRPGIKRGLAWQPLYLWVSRKAIHFEPAPLGKQRSRDATDDIYLACALASGATTIVSFDQDLLTMGKPFGIEIVKPAAFVARFD